MQRSLAPPRGSWINERKRERETERERERDRKAYYTQRATLERQLQTQKVCRLETMRRWRTTAAS